MSPHADDDEESASAPSALPSDSIPMAQHMPSVSELSDPSLLISQGHPRGNDSQPAATAEENTPASEANSSDAPIASVVPKSPKRTASTAKSLTRLSDEETPVKRRPTRSSMQKAMSKLGLRRTRQQGVVKAGQRKKREVTKKKESTRETTKKEVKKPVRKERKETTKKDELKNRLRSATKVSVVLCYKQ